VPVAVLSIVLRLMTTPRCPLCEAGDGEVRRPLCCSKLPAGADIPSTLALVSNVSRSLLSGADQDLDELNRTQELEHRRERKTEGFGAAQNCLAFSIYCLGI
jgi:hypothetical protein